MALLLNTLKRQPLRIEDAVPVMLVMPLYPPTP